MRGHRGASGLGRCGISKKLEVGENGDFSEDPKEPCSSSWAVPDMSRGAGLEERPAAESWGLHAAYGGLSLSSARAAWREGLCVDGLTACC